MRLPIAIRTLWGSRGFTTSAIMTLALGVALNLMVIAVVNAYLLAPLPYPEADRLYSIRYGPPGENAPRGLESLQWSQMSAVLEHPIAWDLDMFYVVGGLHPERTPGAWVTPGFVRGLGIRASIGRTFSADDFREHAPPVAMISHLLWETRFGGNASVLGQHFRAYVSDRPEEAETFTIVGVLPRGFWHVNPYTQVLAPLRSETYPYMARLRAGIPPGEAEQQLTDFVKRGLGLGRPDWHVTLQTVHSAYVAPVRPILSAVAAAAALVLLIACANVAFLLLIRATRREREIAIRFALGATPQQIAKMLLTEGLLLAGAATMGGLGIAYVGLQSLGPLVEAQLGRTVPGGPQRIGLDAVLLMEALAAAAVTALVFALAPLAASWRTSLSNATRSHRGGLERKTTRRTRSALIAVELAASLTLLVGCVLLVRTAAHLMRADLGWHGEHVLAANLALRDHSYPNAAARAAFAERVSMRLRAVPGVEAVALANWPTVAQPRPQAIEIDSRPGSTFRSAVTAVSPDYFSTLAIPLADGRVFSERDRVGAEPVAMVSETLSRRLWPGARAIGHRLAVARDQPPLGGNGSPLEWRLVVGVVNDIRQTPADEDTADVYIPLFQAPTRFMPTYVRTAGTPNAALAALRQAVNEIDPEVSLDATSPGALSTLIDQQLSRPRFLAALLAAFAAFAVLLALIGVYGVIAYAVRQREHEIAVRMAVGASATDVTRLFLRQGIVVLAAGIVIGLYGATIITRLLAPQIVGMRSDDPPTFIVTACGFATAAMLAIWWPARRAARTDPLIVLRQE